MSTTNTKESLQHWIRVVQELNRNLDRIEKSCTKILNNKPDDPEINLLVYYIKSLGRSAVIGDITAACALHQLSTEQEDTYGSEHTFVPTELKDIMEYLEEEYKDLDTINTILNEFGD